LASFHPPLAANASQQVLQESAIPSRHRVLGNRLGLWAVAPTLLVVSWFCAAQQPVDSLQLSRAVRPWEFLVATGSRAGVFGDESGRVEAWVYPLKILRNFRLQFTVGGRVLPAESLARTITARPESTTILYSGDTFAVKETFFVPVNESGAVVTINVETSEPLEVRAVFERDFQLEWPAALGGTFGNWDPDLHAFSFGEEQKKFAALVGSPSAVGPLQEYQTNYSASGENSFSLGVTDRGRETKVVVIAASTQGATESQSIYQRLIANYPALERKSAEYYRAYLERTVSLELPDKQLQQAYDWSRVSMLQGLVTNPFLGSGFVAGYRTSGSGQRPGFAWFFGRDALWTSLAQNAEGDYADTRIALDFLSKYQRADGKITHEIAQSASLVDWFKNYPYPYVSADATPLYIIAMNDYATQSGDSAFVQEKWDSVWKAYQFLRSTYDASGLPQNLGVGHGWVEGGPLLPVRSEIYQSALGAQALRALSEMAHLVGKGNVSRQLSEEFAQQASLLNRTFWLAEKHRFAFAIDKDGNPVDELSVLATVPMWFGLLEEPKALSTISQLAGPDHQADWGMRIISSSSAKYGAGGYHYGSVWPLFTGWASVGEYRYHRALPAYSNLRANALLALDGSLGHVTEVLSGDYYQPLSTSSPHQIWSAAMVVSPLLRGLLGLSTDAKAHQLTFAPHVPADWDAFAVRNVSVGSCKLDLRYRRTEENITLETTRSGAEGECNAEFSPAIALPAEVRRAEMNGHPIPYKVAKNGSDQHVSVRFPANPGTSTLKITINHDFGLGLHTGLPALGSTGGGLRVLSESWSPAGDRLELDVAGRAGIAYELSVLGSAQVTGVEGGELSKAPSGLGRLWIQIPVQQDDSYKQAKILFHFAAKADKRVKKGN
jgi:glycogen debranching enzyme